MNGFAKTIACVSMLSMASAASAERWYQIRVESFAYTMFADADSVSRSREGAAVALVMGDMENELIHRYLVQVDCDRNRIRTMRTWGRNRTGDFQPVLTQAEDWRGVQATGTWRSVSNFVCSGAHRDRPVADPVARLVTHFAQPRRDEGW